MGGGRIALRLRGQLRRPGPRAQVGRWQLHQHAKEREREREREQKNCPIASSSSPKSRIIAINLECIVTDPTSPSSQVADGPPTCAALVPLQRSHAPAPWQVRGGNTFWVRRRDARPAILCAVASVPANRRGPCFRRPLALCPPRRHGWTRIERQIDRLDLPERQPPPSRDGRTRLEQFRRWRRGSGKGPPFPLASRGAHAPGIVAGLAAQDPGDLAASVGRPRPSRALLRAFPGKLIL